MMAPLPLPRGQRGSLNRSMASSPPARNVVFIVADDMGYGDFGFTGESSATPVLDDLAAASRIYSQHASASPVCAPARAALLTGRYPQRTGVIDTLEARGTDRLALDEETIADVLSQHGVVAGLVGKWHTGAIGDAYHPLQRGFAEFAGFRGGWQDYWHWRLERNGVPLCSDGRYLTDVIGDEAVSFLQRHRRQRFYLQVAFNAPHFPYQAPEHLIARHRRPARTERVAVIYAMIEAMDAAVGRIRQTIDDLGLSADTLVVFTSDNGPELGGEGEESAARPNHGLAGAKQHVWEGGIRVPLLAAQSGTVARGEEGAFVHGVDWYPTLLAHLGISHSPARPLDGVDLSATLRGETVAGVPRCWQWTRYRPMPECNAAVRDGRWKLIHPAIDDALGLAERDERIDHDIKAHPERYSGIDAEPPPAPERSTAPLLFDLESDPGEQHDLAEKHPEVRRRLEGLLADWYDDVERDRRREGIPA